MTKMGLTVRADSSLSRDLVLESGVNMGLSDFLRHQGVSPETDCFLQVLPESRVATLILVFVLKHEKAL